MCAMIHAYDVRREGEMTQPLDFNDRAALKPSAKVFKAAITNGMQTLNGIKRVTRAGMGLCQGQTCQELVTRLLAEELGVKPNEVEPMTARGPVRPLRMDVFANS